MAGWSFKHQNSLSSRQEPSLPTIDKHQQSASIPQRHTTSSSRLPAPSAPLRHDKHDTSTPPHFAQLSRPPSFHGENGISFIEDTPASKSHITISSRSNTPDSLSRLGHSTLLFDDSYASYNHSPTPSLSESSSISTQSFNMARERSPAKNPPKPASSSQDQRNPSASALTAGLRAISESPPVTNAGFPTLTDAPRFGQTSIPQSPLVRKQQSLRTTLENKILIQPKKRPEPAKNKLFPNMGAAVPISRPAAPVYTTTKPAPPQSFGSLGNTYGGFFQDKPYAPSTKPSTKPDNFIDLTAPAYRDTLDAGTYTFVDPTKAASDLKALLEGAIEDEDDMPRTRSRMKKKSQSVADDLSAMMAGLDVKMGAMDKVEDEHEDDDYDDGTVEGIKVKLLPHQIDGLAWMQERELGTRKKGTVPKGGILADDMGLGKTLQSISLILTNPKPSDSDEEGGKRFPPNMDKCTLVVAPLALIRQWEIEIKDKVQSSHSLRVVVHHGPQRTKRFQDLKKYDVVITTYQILVSEWGNSTPGSEGLKTGCFGIHWYRVILDEAHTIKNRNAKATQACYALRSEYRWCLTGTPMQNNLDELQSLIKFLRIKPYDDLKEWKDQIDRPMKNGRGDVAIKRLQHYLKIFMKRRTKDILKKEGALHPGGRPSKNGEGNATGFKVTERRIEKVFAEFTPQERVFYEKLESRTDANLEAQMKSGEKVNYASALTMLLRLRQACNHPKLVAGKLGKDMDALAIDGENAAKADKKSQHSNDVDDIANMFGNLDVKNRTCDVCQGELSKSLSKAGAIRCADCEEDMVLVATKTTKKHRKVKHGRHREKRVPEVVTIDDSEEERPQPRKPKNRNLVLDSDDEAEMESMPSRKPRNRLAILDSSDEDEAEWIVGEAERGNVSFGQAGGTDDEDADGTGITLGVENSDTDDDDDDSGLPNLQQLSQTIQPRVMKSARSIDGSLLESESDAGYSEDTASESEVEASLVSSDDDEEAGRLATIITSTKITHLLSILAKEADEHKFIVFSQFTSMLDVIEPFLNRDGYKFTRYDGSMKNDLREDSLNRLRNDKSCRVLLCSLKCGSLGLNLTAATRVVILEPFWNPFVEEQAIDRVHRLTQKTNVIVYKITIKDSVEERILALQEKKRELARAAIESGGAKNAGKLGMQEIMQLFRRDAEVAMPVSNGARNGLGALGERVRVLDSPRKNSSSRAASDGIDVLEQRRAISGNGPANRGVKRSEDSVFGRRW